MEWNDSLEMAFHGVLLKWYKVHLLRYYATLPNDISNHLMLLKMWKIRDILYVKSQYEAISVILKPNKVCYYFTGGHTSAKKTKVRYQRFKLWVSSVWLSECCRIGAEVAEWGRGSPSRKTGEQCTFFSWLPPVWGTALHMYYNLITQYYTNPTLTDYSLYILL